MGVHDRALSRSACFVIGSIVAVAASALLRVASASDSEQARWQRLLQGTYTYSGTNADGEERIQEAIERGTRKMFFLKRGTARGRLKEKNPFRKTIRIGFENGRSQVTFDNEAFSAPLGGGPVPITLPDGDPAMLSQKVVDGQLIEEFVTSEGRRKDIFTPSENGDHLRLEVTITSGQLPEPVRYTLEYVATGE